MNSFAHVKYGICFESTLLEEAHLPKVNPKSAGLAGTWVFGGLDACAESISIGRDGMTSLIESRHHGKRNPSTPCPHKISHLVQLDLFL